MAGAGNQSSPGGAPPGGAGPGQIRDESGVTGSAIDSTRLYWVQYGTRDSIGNYQNDGALMTMKLADRSTAQLGGALAGPNAIALTSNHAYVIVDGAGFVGSTSHPKLLRLSLTDGTTEVIQDGNSPVFSTPVTSFAASGDTMYWSGASTFFWLAGDSAAPSAGTRQASELRTDATNLYFIDANDKTVRTPLAGGVLEELAIETRPYDLNGDSIYGLENPQGGMILTKAAKNNGTWARVRALGEMYPEHLVFAEDRLFAEWTDGANRTGVTTATLGNNSAPVRMLDPASEAVRSWVGTASKVYWTDGPRIYSRAIPTP